VDAVEDLIVSDDLAATLADHPGARGRWGTHSRARSAEAPGADRPGHAMPNTRARRIAETAAWSRGGNSPA